MPSPPTWAVELAGLAWTHPNVEHREMDSEMAMVFAEVMGKHCVTKARVEYLLKQVRTSYALGVTMDFEHAVLEILEAKDG